MLTYRQEIIWFIAGTVHNTKHFCGMHSVVVCVCLNENWSPSPSSYFRNQCFQACHQKVQTDRHLHQHVVLQSCPLCPAEGKEEGGGT